MTKRYLIVEGDSTTHGGKVLASQTLIKVNGKNVALVGDKVFCPKCKGIYVIRAEGQIASYMGKAVASEDMTTSCGAKLVASLRIIKQ